MTSNLLKPRLTYQPFEYPWAYDAYKMQQKLHWIPDEVSMHRDVQDWNSVLTEDEKGLLTNIFRFFTQADCYCPDTEVLTNEGWKFIFDVKKTDKVAQFNEIGEISFSIPSNHIEKEYNGDMFLFEDDLGRTSQYVTSNHKIVYWYKGGRRESLAKDFLPYQGIKLINSGVKWFSQLSLTPLERLKIAFQADGNVKDDVDGSKLGYIPHRFGFKKKRKSDRLHEILKECNLDYNFEYKNEYYNFYVKYPLEKLDKEFSWVDIENISTPYAREFIEELSYWDSHIDEWGKITYSNTNKAAIDIVQILAVMSGYHHSYGSYDDERSEKYSKVYHINIQPNKRGDIDGQSIRRNMKKSPYNGKVYCLTMPKGTLITRLYGKVAFSGNCDVANGYIHKYMPVFAVKPEITMMMSSFANMEAIHIDAYSKLIETLGMSDKIYKEFLEYAEMVDKHDYLKFFDPYPPDHIIDEEGYREMIAESLAVYSAFTEGLQLFSSFAILQHFPRQGKMKGMGQIVTWSMRDESLHVESMIKLFRTFISENLHIWTDDFKKKLYTICRKMVDLEDKFIDLVFDKFSGIEGLNKFEVKEYIRYLADRRLLQLGLKTNYDVRENPLPWMGEVTNTIEHVNFFENTGTEYSKAATTGTWDEVWEEYDLRKEN